MSPKLQAQHPSLDELRELALGFSENASADSIAEIEEHVLECPTCWEALQLVPKTDAFVDALRSAYQEESAATSNNRPQLAAAISDHDSARRCSPVGPAERQTLAIWAQSTISARSPVDATDPLPQTDPTSSAPTEPLRRLDHYEVLNVLGCGGMGVVLKARDSRLNRLVAIKMLAPELSGNDVARQRFEREARAAAAIRNDQVVTIFAVSTEGPVPYLVMEYIAGHTLEVRISSKTRCKNSLNWECSDCMRRQRGLIMTTRVIPTSLCERDNCWRSFKTARR